MDDASTPKAIIIDPKPSAPIKYTHGKHPNSVPKSKPWPKLEIDVNNVTIVLEKRRKVKKGYKEMTTADVHNLRNEWTQYCNVIDQHFASAVTLRINFECLEFELDGEFAICYLRIAKVRFS